MRLWPSSLGALSTRKSRSKVGSFSQKDLIAWTLTQEMLRDQKMLDEMFQLVQ
jgi:hypothetical protein